MSSDVDVFEQVIMGTEYRPLDDLSPEFILDLGANIGLSAAWFLSTFPKATLLAVEPNPNNYDLCYQNLSAYGGRARSLLGAAWSKRTKLVLSHSSGDGREWTSCVRPHNETVRADEAEVEGWDIGSLMDLCNTKAIDLLKIDVERAESEIFGKNCDNWLSLVRNICIELHGAECEDVFFAALKNYNYQLLRSGELTICRNLRPIRRHDRSGSDS